MKITWVVDECSVPLCFLDSPKKIRLLTQGGVEWFAGVDKVSGKGIGRTVTERFRLKVDIGVEYIERQNFRFC